jgi:hypothetical protein
MELLSDMAQVEARFGANRAPIFAAVVCSELLKLPDGLISLLKHDWDIRCLG